MSAKMDYTFPDSLNIQKMSSFNLEMKKIFSKKKGTVNMDLRPLKSIDIAVVQVLAAYVKNGLENDKSIILKGPLDPLLQDTLEEMDIIRADSAFPVLFEQIAGGLKIDF